MPLRRDDGASMVLALVVVMLVSVSGISLLALAGVSSRNTAITRSRLNQLYAADGGIETGIETLDADQLDGSPTICPGVSTGFSPVTTVTINGRPVTVTCKTSTGGTTSSTTGGGSALLNGYAAVFGSSGMVVGGNSGNGAPSTLFNGKVYSGGAISAPAAAALRIDGNLDYYVACPPLPANVTLSGTGVCAHPAAPVITPPTVVVPTVTAPPSVLKTGDAGCRIFYPGKYTTAPAFSGTGRYYLASGTYYFAGPGDVNLLGTIFGGAPGSETKQITGSSPCATDANASTQTPAYVSTNVGSGVEIIFGGNGVFRTQDPSTVELYSRVPGTGAADYGATAGVTIWGQAAANGNYTPGLSNSTPFNTQNKNNTIVIHGLVYLPDSLAQIREPLNPGTSAGPFMGGLMLKGLIIDNDGNTSPDPPETTLGGTPVTQVTTYPTRTLLLCSIATQVSGGASAPPTVIEAAVQMAANPVVQSWRDLSATTC